MDLKSKIQSIKDTFDINYVKPNAELVDKYRKFLADSNVALDYLHVGRGLNSKTLDHFNIGYDPVRNAITIPVYGDSNGKSKIKNNAQ